MRIAAAAALYFAIVFGAGFLLGPIRLLWLEPRVGPLAAVLCETPFILAIIITAANWVPRLVRSRRRMGVLLLMGAGALTLQQLADFILGITLRGMSPADHLDQFTRPEGQIYAVLLVAFATMPLLRNHKPTQS